MSAVDRLDALVHERLGGDTSRLLELFEDREVFDLLKAADRSADWYHFVPRTLDGEYLVETTDGSFQIYWQERGAKTAVNNFLSLRDAAQAFFRWYSIPS